MIDIIKIKRDLSKLKKVMIKMGYKKDYVNQFLTETMQEVIEEKV